MTASRWEYMVLGVEHTRKSDLQIGGEKVSRIGQNERILNALGAEGWELIGVMLSAYGMLFLKRPLPPVVTVGGAQPGRGR
jgi:hypothetical protein